MDPQLILRLIGQVVVTLILTVFYAIVCLVKQVVPYKYRCKSIKGETVLITGTGSGLGKSLAKKMAKLDTRMILVDIDTKSNEQTAKEIIEAGGKAFTFTCDLSKKEDIYKISEEIKRTVGNVDIIVNNAGIVTGKKFLDSADNLIEKTFAVNTTSHFWLGKAFFPYMIENNHGHIVSVSSVAGLFGTSGLGDYCASKFAVVGFEESLRNELQNLKKTGVKTTLVCPYYINTGMFQGTQSEVIPFLDQEFVTDKILEAILTDQRILMLPKIMYFIYFFKGVFPEEVLFYIADHVFKTNSGMDSFVGRSKSN